MNPPKRRLTKDDLEGWGMKALKHWRRHRPNLVRELEAAGVLFEHLKEAEVNAENLYVELMKSGRNPWEATNLAEREFIILPDVEPENESPVRESNPTPPPA